MGKFRETCINTFNLNPVHFYSAPGWAWTASLKITNVELELLPDTDMFLMIESGIRYGICNAVLCHAKANNKYMKNQDESKESSYIGYLEKNNLYVRCSMLVGQHPMKSLSSGYGSVCPSVYLSLSFLKIGSLVFCDILHDDS